MNIPPWLAAIVGGLVLVFGVYRIRLAFRSDDEQESAKERGGLYAMGRRTHFLIGLAYALMGVLLLASAFGFKLLPSIAW